MHSFSWQVSKVLNSSGGNQPGAVSRMDGKCMTGLVEFSHIGRGNSIGYMISLVLINQNDDAAAESATG